MTSTIGALTPLPGSRKEKGRPEHQGQGSEKAKEGLYQGGYAPYGLDVACYDRTGKEKWRVLYTGHFERTKIHPDGTREEFNGKGNFPAKDPTDELRLAPSVDPRRMEVVRQVFETYASEAIALRAIATRLNDLGVDPVFGDVWNQPKIKHMLGNPAYIGFPAWNKRGGSRFVEFIDGAFREVPRDKGRVVAGRQRRREDFVQAEEPAFEPIVPREVWDKVERKLDEAKNANEGKGAKKGPRSPELWLRGFLVCGRCGKPMRGWHPRNDKYLWKSYFCGTYGDYGAKNPTGCKLHRVKAELLEQVAERYLEEKHRQLRMTIEAQQRGDDELTRPQEEDLASRWAELAAIERRMEEDLRERPGPPTRSIDPLWLEKDPESDLDVARRLDWVSVTRVLWQFFHGQRKRDLAPEIREAEAELERLVGAYAGLPRGASRAREMANRRIEELETKIGVLEGQQEDLGKRWDELSAEFRRRYESLAIALEALQIDGEYRRKAEALRTPKIVRSGWFATSGIPTARGNSPRASWTRSRSSRSRDRLSSIIRTQPRRSQVDHDPVDRPPISRVHQRPFDPVCALADGGLGEPDQDGLRHRRRGHVDLDFNRRRVDADEGVRRELREHDKGRRRGAFGPTLREWTTFHSLAGDRLCHISPEHRVMPILVVSR